MSVVIVHLLVDLVTHPVAVKLSVLKMTAPCSQMRTVCVQSSAMVEIVNLVNLIGHRDLCKLQNIEEFFFFFTG